MKNLCFANLYYNSNITDASRFSLRKNRLQIALGALYIFSFLESMAQSFLEATYARRDRLPRNESSWNQSPRLVFVSSEYRSFRPTYEKCPTIALRLICLPYVYSFSSPGGEGGCFAPSSSSRYRFPANFNDNQCRAVDADASSNTCRQPRAE